MRRLAFRCAGVSTQDTQCRIKRGASEALLNVRALRIQESHSTYEEKRYPSRLHDFRSMVEEQIKSFIVVPMNRLCGLWTSLSGVAPSHNVASPMTTFAVDQDRTNQSILETRLSV